MQQPYLSSPPDAGGVPHRSAKTPAKAQGQHAGVHIPWRSSAAPSAVNASTAVAEACCCFCCARSVYERS